MIDDLRRLVDQLERDVLLFKSDRLVPRIEALDLLDACPPGEGLSTDDLYPRVRDLRVRLESANEEAYERIREEIRRGKGGESLLRWARGRVADEDTGRAGGLGYGFLDELVSGVLGFEEPGASIVFSDAEMVAYQPTPARHIFDLIEATKLTTDDVLIDLGSGLGHVPILISICSPACSIGIELDPNYVERARQCSQSLNLGRPVFLNQDARDADLSAGTVFYLYTPFTGSILRSVLDRLHGEAGSRPIRVCSYGPCTPAIAGQPWLETSARPTIHRIAVFQSRL